MEIFLSVNKQNELNLNFSKKCPLNSYARKNIGYLLAFKNNADVIIETDDDNYHMIIFLKINN